MQDSDRALQRRRASAQANQKLSAAGRDVSVLRRKQLRSEKTQVLYQETADTFMKSYGLSPNSPSALVDRCLEMELNNKYHGGEMVARALITYYAIRWFYELPKEMLRFANAAKKSFIKACPSPSQEQICWEEVLLMCI